ERSILFWKSLPVSDLTTVLSKTSVPLVVLPLVSFAVIVATQFMMLLISTAALLPSGLAATTWANFNLLQQSLVLLYGLIAIALWHAPIYGWALLVSGWVRRATFLWAVLPLLGIAFFEKITFNPSMVITGPFALIYVPNKLIMRGNAAATADNILAHETMFRLAILADLIGAVIFICLGIALYKLLSGVSKTWAGLMVAFVLVSA